MISLQMDSLSLSSSLFSCSNLREPGRVELALAKLCSLGVGPEKGSSFLVESAELQDVPWGLDDLLRMSDQGCVTGSDYRCACSRRCPFRNMKIVACS